MWKVRIGISLPTGHFLEKYTRRTEMETLGKACLWADAMSQELTEHFTAAQPALAARGFSVSIQFRPPPTSSAKPGQERRPGSQRLTTPHPLTDGLTSGSC